MKLQIQLTGGVEKNCVVELERAGSDWKGRVEGGEAEADLAWISPNLLSILYKGRSFEVWITPLPDGKLKLQIGAGQWEAERIDPRAWSGRRHGHHPEAEGRQPILAPMPGKVVRVLVEAGERVEIGQGLLVVEAMKMQNQIRSPKSGQVERVLVKEGQPVNAGEILAWVE